MGEPEVKIQGVFYKIINLRQRKRYNTIKRKSLRNSKRGKKIGNKRGNGTMYPAKFLQNHKKISISPFQ